MQKKMYKFKAKQNLKENVKNIKIFLIYFDFESLQDSIHLQLLWNLKESSREFALHTKRFRH